MQKAQTTNKKSRARHASRSIASENDENFEKPDADDLNDEDFDDNVSLKDEEEDSDLEPESKPIRKINRGGPNKPAVVTAPIPTAIKEEQPLPNVGAQMDLELPARASRSQVPQRVMQPTATARALSKPKKQTKTDQHRATDVLALSKDIMAAKRNLTFKDKFDEALNHLQENFVPEELPCRDKEKRIIHDFIESGLRNKGNSQTLCRIALMQMFRVCRD